MKRLKTPPPGLDLGSEQLLTPPPTGGSNKRNRFDTDPETPSKRILNSQRAEELGFACYTEIQELSDDSQELCVSTSSSEEASDTSSPKGSKSSFASNVSGHTVRTAFLGQHFAY